MCTITQIRVYDNIVLIYLSWFLYPIIGILVVVSAICTFFNLYVFLVKIFRWQQIESAFLRVIRTI